jgi:hypothetical protein
MVRNRIWKEVEDRLRRGYRRRSFSAKWKRGVPPENFQNDHRGDLISPCSPAEKLLLQSLSFNFTIFKIAYSLNAIAFLLKNR